MLQNGAQNFGKDFRVIQNKSIIQNKLLYRQLVCITDLFCSNFNSPFIVACLHQWMDSKEFNPYWIQSCSPFTICLIVILIFSTDIAQRYN